MRFHIIIPFLVVLLAGCYQNDQLSLVWSDEFDSGVFPDESKWTLVQGNGCPGLCGFGNNEKQYYTNSPDNVRLDDGKLVIMAHYHPDSTIRYTSAKLISRNKGDWTYGNVEIRAKLPGGRGTWPALWMMPTTKGQVKWPLDGEIDIMEHVGYNEGWVHGAVHTKDYNGMYGTQKVDSIYVDDAQDEFHVYSIDWSAEEISWKVDGELFHSYQRTDNDQENWPYNKPFHVIINMAIGGNWAGIHGIDSSTFPHKLEIDYVRVYD